MTKQTITLTLAILGAVTGTIAFSVQMLEGWKYRPRVTAELTGVYRMNVEQHARKVVAVVVEFRNRGKERITILGTPDLIVIDSTGKVRGRFNLDPLEWDKPLDTILEPLEVKRQPYDGREIENAIANGNLADLFSPASGVRFKLIGKSTAGRFTSEEVSLQEVDEDTVGALRLLGKIGQGHHQSAHGNAQE
jgi:hypothetical protein